MPGASVLAPPTTGSNLPLSLASFDKFYGKVTAGMGP